MNSFAHRLVQHAARSAPSELSERLEEEWLADLADRRGFIAQVRFGIGVCWATRVIAHDLSLAKVPAAATVTGPKTMTAYVKEDAPLITSRTTVLLLIVGLHAFFLYALMTGLAHNVMSAPQSMTAKFLPEAPTPTEPPPPAPLDFKPQPVNIPQPDRFFDDPPPDTSAIQNVVLQPNDQPSPTPPVTERAVHRVMGGPGKGFPNTMDYYPSSARRMGEQGISAVRVCVDEKGGLTEPPTLAHSSGSARIDEGALRLARAGSGRYRPSTEDGQSVSSCYSFRIKFELKD